MSERFQVIPRIFSKRLSNLMVGGIILLSGIMIYVLLRPSDYIFYNWTEKFGINDWLYSLRIHPSTVSNYLPEWFVFSLPNGLWAFAYAFFISTIWRDSKSLIKYFWMTSIPLLIFGYEGLQYFNFIPGTFCYQDLLFGSLGFITGILIGTKSIKIKSHEKEIA